VPAASVRERKLRVRRKPATLVSSQLQSARENVRAPVVGWQTSELDSALEAVASTLGADFVQGAPEPE
jgi:hypothetical protein